MQRLSLCAHGALAAASTRRPTPLRRPAAAGVRHCASMLFRDQPNGGGRTCNPAQAAAARAVANDLRQPFLSTRRRVIAWGVFGMLRLAVLHDDNSMMPLTLTCRT